MAAPVVIVDNGGLPVTFAGELAVDFATPMTVVDDHGAPVTLCDHGIPVALLNPDGSPYEVEE